jgi:hypothetical protein
MADWLPVLGYCVIAVGVGAGAFVIGVWWGQTTSDPKKH